MNFANAKPALFRILIAVFFAVLSLGQLQRFQLTSHVAVYLHEMILSGLIVLFLPELLTAYRKLLGYASQHPLTLVFALFLGIQTLFIQLLHPDIVPVLYLVRLGLYTQLGVLVHLAIENRMMKKTQLLHLFLGMIVLIGVFGVVQYVFYPDTRWLLLLGWDDHYYRLISTLFDPGFTGLILAIGVVVYTLTQKNFKWWLFGLFIGLGMVSVLLTYSRATYVALILVSVFNLWVSKYKKQFLIILCFFAIIPLLPRPASEGVKLERTASIFSRINSNQAALQSLSLTEVIWGKGLYTAIPASLNNLPNHATAPDNSFVYVFVSLGVLGSVLLLLAMWQLRFTFLSEPIRSVMLLVGIHSLFNNSVFYAWTLIALATLLGMNRLRFK